MPSATPTRRNGIRATPTGRCANSTTCRREYRANVETDPPFGGHPGDPPALSDAEIDDIVAFLHTLTDGYRPPPVAA